MRGYLDTTHYTRLVEGPRGTWTPECSCGATDIPQETRRYGYVLLEDHERYVTHIRRPDLTMTA